MAKAVKVSELKASLSRYLKRVKAGEEVVVTERGKPVAKLVPMPPGFEELPEHMQRMVLEGRLRLGRGLVGSDFWNLPRIADPEGWLIRYVLEDRERGW
ncbi:MAG: type II toxin-antitoxin system Phd/YefM family antitoxin [Gemmatimonadales bacterium]